MSNPESPPGKALLSFDVEASQKTLNARSDVERPIREAEQDVPWLDGVRGETLTVMGGGHLPFPRAGEIEVSLLR